MIFDVKHFHLKNHPLFNSLSNDEINHINVITENQTFRKDDTIYESGNEIDKIYILIQGRVKISYCFQNDMEVVSEILKDDDIFGELCLIKMANRNGEFAKVYSEEAIIYSFSLKNFAELINSKNSIATAFSRILSAKLKIISTKYADLIFKDVKDRVINFLKLHARYEGVWDEKKVEIQMFMNHQDIADFTASSRQTVSTILNRLVKEGKIIYEGRHKLTIPDIGKLE